MTVQDNKTRTEPQIRRTWRDHLVVSVLIAGGLLTVIWIAVLMMAGLQIIGAVAGTVGGG